VCWLHKRELIAAINKLTDEEADDEHALSAEARLAKLGELGAETLQVERFESCLVWRGLETGENVSHRIDVSPLAVSASNCGPLYDERVSALE